MHKSPDVISLKKFPLTGAPGSDFQFLSWRKGEEGKAVKYRCLLFFLNKTKTHTQKKPRKQKETDNNTNCLLMLKTFPTGQMQLPIKGQVHCSSEGSFNKDNIFTGKEQSSSFPVKDAHAITVQLL